MRQRREMSFQVKVEVRWGERVAGEETSKRWYMRENSRLAVLWKPLGKNVGGIDKADWEGIFFPPIPSGLGASLPMSTLSRVVGVDTDSKIRGHPPGPVSFPGIFILAPTHCLIAASAESRSLCNSHKPVSRPKNTSFISYKCLSPSSSNMLRVTTFSASWGSCPLHTVITHSIKAVSRLSFSALFSWPFATAQWKGEHAASLCVQNSHHFGSHLEIDDPGGEVSLFCSFLSLAWSQCNLFGAFLLLFYTSNRENGDLFPYNLIIAWIACPSLVRWRGIRGAEYKLLGMPTTSFNLFGYYSSQWNEDIIFAQFISVPFRQDRYAKPSDTP